MSVQRGVSNGGGDVLWHCVLAAGEELRSTCARGGGSGSPAPERDWDSDRTRRLP